MLFNERVTGVLRSGRRPVETILLTILVSLAVARVSCAQPVPSLVATGKDATGLLVSEKYQRSGTAFCISPGYFVTNEHVAGEPGDQLKLILHSAEDDESVHDAIVLRADADLDLAVLHSPMAKNISPHLKGEIGLSNRQVSYGTALGRLTSVGPHLVRIRKLGDMVTFEIDADNDGPSPGDLQRTVPSIREFVPVLHEKNTYLLFGGAARFRSVAFHID